ncbi:MAG: hypothetical protein IT382_10545, partial [Deltaproteobacteria bacterium]|nr:hypothetical protein [Deltaproteobacteria bacterium]
SAAVADGDLGKADQLLQTACEGARAKKLGRLTAALCARAELFIAQRRTEEARALVDEAMSRATSPDTGSPYDEAVARRLLAHVQPAQAEEHLRRALGLSEEMKNPIQDGLACLELARSLGQQGRAPDARTFAERARTRFGALGNKLQLQRVADLEGVL